MTIIRANCPDCGDVLVDASDMVVRVRFDAKDERGFYAFQCPCCGQAVARDASRRIVDLLVAEGVRLEAWRKPAELDEPHSGPPINYDDILDFHEGMQDNELHWFKDLVLQVRRRLG